MSALDLARDVRLAAARGATRSAGDLPGYPEPIGHRRFAHGVRREG